MSLSDREFLGDSTEPEREGMSYQTAVKIMDKVISSYLRSGGDSTFSDYVEEKKVTEAYNIIRNG